MQKKFKPKKRFFSFV